MGVSQQGPHGPEAVLPPIPVEEEVWEPIRESLVRTYDTPAPYQPSWWKRGLSSVGLMTRSSEKTVRRALTVLDQRKRALEDDLREKLPQVEELYETREAILELKGQLPIPLLPGKDD